MEGTEEVEEELRVSEGVREDSAVCGLEKEDVDDAEMTQAAVTGGFTTSSLMVWRLTSRALEGRRRDICGVAGLDYRRSKAVKKRKAR